MVHTAQNNYEPILTRMFVRLANLMLDEDLALGPPVFNQETGDITQLCGMCPLTSGSICTYKHLGNDLWNVCYDDGEESANLLGKNIGRWFTGDYGDNEPGKYPLLSPLDAMELMDGAKKMVREYWVYVYAEDNGKDMLTCHLPPNEEPGWMIEGNPGDEVFPQTEWVLI